MADLKKSFDEVKEAASGLASGNVMTSLQKDVSDALHIGDIDKPASETPAIEPSATPAIEAPVTPTTAEAPSPQTFVEAEVKAATEPMDLTPPAEIIKDAKAS
jgi:sec-independent protein translocase protein TatB